MADWSTAPADVFWKIIERLSIADYIRLGAVCLSWRGTLAEKRQPPRAAFPWLLLPDYMYINRTMRCFSLSDNKEYRLKLPHLLRGLTCIGSSHGWLLLMEATPHSEIFMFDPFSRDLAMLPSVDTLPPPADVGRYTEFYTYGKVTLSLHPSSCFIASAINYSTRSLAFARKGDKSWTAIQTPGDHRFYDIEFYQGQLCGLTIPGRVIVYDLSDVTSPSLTLLVQPPGLEFNFKENLKSLWYLVESADDLLVVRRGIREGNDGGLVTMSIIILKMHRFDDEVHWVEQKNLGDQVLLLGRNPSLSVSSRDFQELPRNCIYLTKIHSRQDSRSDLCVYQMLEGLLEPFLSLSTTNLNFPQIFWFSPNLTLS